MDSKNVIAAIALSSAVIVLYSLFFIPEKVVTDQNIVEKKKIEQNTDTPTIEQKESLIKISRDEALKQNKRVKFENDNIIGSISLKGASIDDLTFKNYKVDLDDDKKIILLGPRNIDEGYFVESGFVTTDKNIDIPNSESIWSIVGNNKLTSQNSIKLSWTNDQEITFEKEISLDDKYLFTIKQRVINGTKKKYDFYSYGQIIRNKIPENITDFYILHEGLVATLDEELIEEDYDDIQDKKFTRLAEKGWLGIGDKYWITSLIPPRNKEFKTTFDYKDKFRANFITTDPLTLNKNSSIEEELQIIVAAKRVDVIDGYAKSLNIDKFDLVIDWGFLYFITKPLFFGIDYFFQITWKLWFSNYSYYNLYKISFFSISKFFF